MIGRALTIAGSDPSGGAGIQQDLRTFAALGVWGLSAITAVTVQDTARVHAWRALDADEVRAQIDAVLDDVGCDAAKTGMLATVAIVEAVAGAVDRHGVVNLVVDPVLRATVGGALADADLARAIAASLVPRAALVTPNAEEAAVLTGIAVGDRATQVEAAHALVASGARAALVTGGHLDGDAADVLADADGVETYVAPRAPGADPHGTGCLLSAAIAARLARGDGVRAAVAGAKRIVSAAIARPVRLGARPVLDAVDVPGT